jgi:hypothetical protein
MSPLFSVCRIFSPTGFHGARPGRKEWVRPGREWFGDSAGQVLVVAIGLLIAPEGRWMYFCAVVLPWYRLCAT